ncbi:MAG: hypothetical protein MI724_20240, partial [Spirochaetales bacterium]|nr:hypothetical protein [Spirochaetales bacterium]
IAVIVCLATVAALALWSSRRPPHIETIEPEVARPNQVVSVSGRAFGGAGRVELDGIAVPPEYIREWSDRTIAFALPEQVQSGLLRVETTAGISNPVFLTNGRDLPTHTPFEQPTVVSLNEAERRAGETVVIRGGGFGPRSALASITLAGDGHTREISADGTFVTRWTDREVRFVIPSGIPAGRYDVSFNAIPTGIEVPIAAPRGAASLGEPRRFAVRQSLVAVGADERMLAVFPAPPETAEQPSVQLLRETVPSEPAPRRTGWIYRFESHTPEVGEGGAEIEVSQRLERVILVERRPVRWEVDEGLSSAVLLDPDFSAAYLPFLRREADLPVGSTPIADLSGRLDVRASPLSIALDIHLLVIGLLEPDPGGTGAVTDALDGLAATSRGYASLAVTLARHVGLPARRHHGLLLDDGGQTRVHSWVEFYIPAVGWIPADPALGDTMYGADFVSTAAYYGEDPARGSFGAVDGRRVTIAVDGLTPPRIYPTGRMISPDSSWAPGALWVELPDDRVSDVLSIRWDAPTLFAQF